MNIRSLLVILLALPSVYAAELKPETLAAWDQYIQAANSHMQERLRSNVSASLKRTHFCRFCS
ncbi:MAG TPA: hypothetical protein VLU73_16565 [Methylococcaceae bacterium]|nr:hypothetical protein [Methylococcaceae bacterium]